MVSTSYGQVVGTSYGQVVGTFSGTVASEDSMHAHNVGMRDLQISRRALSVIVSGTLKCVESSEKDRR